MDPHRIKKNVFPNAFHYLQLFSFNSRPKFSFFGNMSFFEKMAISASQTVDKTENAKNNEIKISILPRIL